jgi:glycosyltransferase involved in cell wall biosynthesis
LPVVASDFPSIREIVAGHQCGVLVDPITGVQSAVQAITGWWQDRPSGVDAGERGRQAVMTRYNWEQLMEQLSDLYQALLPEK